MDNIEKKIKRETETLWKRCFPSDSEEFVKLYFSSVYSDDNNHFLLRKNSVAAALQAIPVTLKTDDKQIKAAYISGVCTAPEYRKSGLMKELMVNTHEKLKQEGYEASCLIPAEKYLFKIYENMGYRVAFYKDYEVVSIDETILSKEIQTREAKMSDKEPIFDYFDYMQNKKNGIIISHKFFDAIFQSFFLEKNPIWITTNSFGEIVGIVFTIENNIPLIMASNAKIEKMTLQNIMAISNFDKLKIKKNRKGDNYGMICPLTPNISIPATDSLTMTLMLDE